MRGVRRQTLRAARCVCELRPRIGARGVKRWGERSVRCRHAERTPRNDATDPVAGHPRRHARVVDRLGRHAAAPAARGVGSHRGSADQSVGSRAAAVNGRPRHRHGDGYPRQPGRDRDDPTADPARPRGAQRPIDAGRQRGCRRSGRRRVVRRSAGPAWAAPSESLAARPTPSTAAFRRCSAWPCPTVPTRRRVRRASSIR